jgi:hypothetical protein
MRARDLAVNDHVEWASVFHGGSPLGGAFSRFAWVSLARMSISD